MCVLICPTFVLSGTYSVGTIAPDSVAEMEPALWSFIFAFTFIMHRPYYFGITFSGMSFLTLNKQGSVRNIFLPLF